MKTTSLTKEMKGTFTERLREQVKMRSDAIGSSFDVLSYNSNSAIFVSHKTGAMYEYTEPMGEGSGALCRLDFSADDLKTRSAVVCRNISECVAEGTDPSAHLREYRRLVDERNEVATMPLRGMFPLSEQDRAKVFARLMNDNLFREYLTSLASSIREGKALMIEAMPFIGLRAKDKLIKFFKEQIGLTYEQARIITYNLLNFGLGQKFHERFDYKNLVRAISSQMPPKKARALAYTIMETVATSLLGEAVEAAPAEFEDGQTIVSDKKGEFKDAAGKDLEPGQYTIKKDGDSVTFVPAKNPAQPHKGVYAAPGTKIKKEGVGDEPEADEAESAVADTEAEFQEMEDFEGEASKFLNAGEAELSEEEQEIASVRKMIEDLRKLAGHEGKEGEKDEVKALEDAIASLENYANNLEKPGEEAEKEAEEGSHEEPEADTLPPPEAEMPAEPALPPVEGELPPVEGEDIPPGDIPPEPELPPEGDVPMDDMPPIEGELPVEDDIPPVEGELPVEDDIPPEADDDFPSMEDDAAPPVPSDDDMPPIPGDEELPSEVPGDDEAPPVPEDMEGGEIPPEPTFDYVPGEEGTVPEEPAGDELDGLEVPEMDAEGEPEDVGEAPPIPGEEGEEGEDGAPPVEGPEPYDLQIHVGDGYEFEENDISDADTKAALPPGMYKITALDGEAGIADLQDEDGTTFKVSLHDLDAFTQSSSPVGEIEPGDEFEVVEGEGTVSDLTSEEQLPPGKYKVKDTDDMGVTLNPMSEDGTVDEETSYKIAFDDFGAMARVMKPGDEGEEGGEAPEPGETEEGFDLNPQENKKSDKKTLKEAEGDEEEDAPEVPADLLEDDPDADEPAPDVPEDIDMGGTPDPDTDFGGGPEPSDDLGIPDLTGDLPDEMAPEPPTEDDFDFGTPEPEPAPAPAPEAAPQKIEVHCDCGPGDKSADEPLPDDLGPAPDLPPDMAAMPDAEPVDFETPVDDLEQKLNGPDEGMAEGPTKDEEANSILSQLENLKTSVLGHSSEEEIPGEEGTEKTYQKNAEVQEYVEVIEGLIAKLTESPDEYTKGEARQFLTYFEDVSGKGPEAPESTEAGAPAEGSIEEPPKAKVPGA